MLDNLFLDKRPIADMPFAPEVAERVRNILITCGCTVADDINRLGCTGVVEKQPEPILSALPDSSLPAALESAVFLRLGLAGGGVGLPCFVPINRFCLVHNTIGGLEPGQLQRYPEQVTSISRELTAEEHGKVALIEAARRTGRNDIDTAADVLAGRQDASDMLREVTGGADEDAAFDKTMAGARLGAQTWKCTEHTTTNWACRHCVAQAIVEGPLETAFVISENQSVDAVPMGCEGVLTRLKHADGSGVDALVLFTRVATFTRKLSRD